MEKLRECPTCGSENIINCIQGEPGHEDKWTQCKDCNTITTFGKWNIRQSDARIKELEEEVGYWKSQNSISRNLAELATDTLVSRIDKNKELESQLQRVREFGVEEIEKLVIDAERSSSPMLSIQRYLSTRLSESIHAALQDRINGAKDENIA